MRITSSSTMSTLSCFLFAVEHVVMEMVVGERRSSSHRVALSGGARRGGGRRGGAGGTHRGRRRRVGARRGGGRHGGVHRGGARRGRARQGRRISIRWTLWHGGTRGGGGYVCAPFPRFDVMVILPTRWLRAHILLLNRTSIWLGKINIIEYLYLTFDICDEEYPMGANIHHFPINMRNIVGRETQLPTDQLTSGGSLADASLSVNNRTPEMRGPQNRRSVSCIQKDQIGYPTDDNPPSDEPTMGGC
ncbi:hypothetical protein BC936DRAFT_137181 [Jimgerdemannia flammicorona]|uniref:Uncharacterized protein n=1 Tax=Jimgerdemannia flammicorona TaxID=994334 RepID=A0A433CXX6_9FUNG|nr:hypothetical protein BC936DRAFT_137181 [Jimgerdemannia flammicorona]